MIPIYPCTHSVLDIGGKSTGSRPGRARAQNFYFSRVQARARAQKTCARSSLVFGVSSSHSIKCCEKNRKIFLEIWIAHILYINNPKQRNSRWDMYLELYHIKIILSKATGIKRTKEIPITLLFRDGCAKEGDAYSWKQISWRLLLLHCFCVLWLFISVALFLFCRSLKILDDHKSRVLSD